MALAGAFMIVTIIYYLCFLAVIGAAGLSAWSDWRGMTIPNRYSVIVIAAYFIAFAFNSLLGGDIQSVSFLKSHFAAAGIMFVISFILFATKVMGAGDSKLGTALALWVGLKGLAPMLFGMAVIGAILSLATIILRKKVLWIKAPEGSWVAQAQAGRNAVPYGIAIVAGAFFAFLKLGMFTVY
jgi:prepilin peptidase CpaA